MFNIVEVVPRNRFSFFANRGASHNTVLVFFALDGFFTKSHKIGANCRTSGNRKTPQRKNDPRKKQGFTSLSDHRSSIFWILVNRIKASKTNKKTNAKENTYPTKAWTYWKQQNQHSFKFQGWTGSCSHLLPKWSSWWKAFRVQWRKCSFMFLTSYIQMQSKSMPEPCSD